MKKKRKYKFKTKPRPYQVKALKKLVRKNGGNLWVPMRWGKTKVAIDWAGAMYVKHGVTRFLVVCPKSVIGVWKSEIKKHLPDGTPIEFYIVNYERTYDREYDDDRSWEPVDSIEIARFEPQAMIIDEAHRIGDPSARQSKQCWRIKNAHHIQLILELTGTPFHRNPLRTFGMFKVLDDGIFGTSYTTFKKQYALFGGYGGYKLLKYKNLKRMRQKIAPLTYYRKQTEYKGITHQPFPVRLSESLPAYRSMADKSIVKLSKGRLSTAEIVLTKHLRLSQIACGWIRTDEGEWVRVGREKQQALSDHVGDMYENGVPKFVLATRFIPALRDAASVCKDRGYKLYLLHGGVAAGEREQRIAEFDETDEPAAFVMQASTGREGIDLSAADTLLWYGYVDSLVDYDQVNARIRKYKERRKLNYVHFTAEGTVDEVTLSALQAKRDVAEYVLNHPTLLDRSPED